MSFLSWESVFMAESLQQVTAEWESSDDDATPITMRSCLSSVCRADGPRAVGVCRTSAQGIPDHRELRRRSFCRSTSTALLTRGHRKDKSQIAGGCGHREKR